MNLIRMTGSASLFNQASLAEFLDTIRYQPFAAEQFSSADAPELRQRVADMAEVAAAETTQRAFLEYGAAFADNRDYRYARKSRISLRRKSLKGDWQRHYIRLWKTYVMNNLRTDLEKLASDSLNVVATTPDSAYRKLQ